MQRVHDEPSQAELTPIAEVLGPGARYEPRRLLGRGGMGEVYEAVHRALGSRVVIKVIRADRANNPQSVARMRVEAQALARLTHPNLVRVTDFDLTAGGQPFFVMEYLEGRSLGEELAVRGRLGIGEALDIATQALEGLASAHDAGVVHRDIKPDNIFLCRAGGRVQVKVLDFGIAKLVAGAADAASTGQALTTPGRVVGTPRYVSPEQATLRPLDGRVDIYAMGLVLYEMLVGRGPFDDLEETVDIIRAHVRREPDPPSRHLPSLPSTLDAIVVRCLHKRPEQRFATARELAHALHDAWRSAHQAALQAGSAPAPNLAQTAPPIPPHRSAPAAIAASSPPVPTLASASERPLAMRPSAPAPVASPIAPVAGSEPRLVPFGWVVVVLVASGVLASLATHLLHR